MHLEGLVVEAHDKIFSSKIIIVKTLYLCLHTSLCGSGHTCPTMSIIETDVNNYMSSYYGTEERSNNSDFSHKVISKMSGGSLAIAKF